MRKKNAKKNAQEGEATHSKGKLLKLQRKHSQAMVKRHSPLDIVRGLRDKDLHKVQRGFYSLMSMVPGLGSRMIGSITPYELLNNDIAALEENCVNLERKIRDMKDVNKNYDSVTMKYRARIAKSKDLLPFYIEETTRGPALIPYTEKGVEDVKATLKNLGFDPTDPTMVSRMTPEIGDLVLQQNKLENKLSVYRRRAARHRAKIGFYGASIEENESAKRRSEATTIAAEEQREYVLIRLDTVRQEQRTLSTNLRLQEAIYDTHDAEKNVIKTVNELTLLVARANADLSNVLEASARRTIDVRVLAYSDRTAAALQANLHRLQLRAGEDQPQLRQAYTLLGVKPTATAQEIADAYQMNVEQAGSDERTAALQEAVHLVIPNLRELDSTMPTYVPPAKTRALLNPKPEVA